jgi:hypothetical protein
MKLDSFSDIIQEIPEGLPLGEDIHSDAPATPHLPSE